MSKKIGDLLIERGLLERRQLNRALQAHFRLGGHLGTSLIELGFIGEATLGTTLADMLGLRYAPAEYFEEIPRSVIATFTPELVRKVRAVPIGHVGKTLQVAVIEPRSLASCSVSMGCKIVPWIAPEFRVLLAMETYYGIQRRARYIKLSYQLDGQSVARPPRPTSHSELGVSTSSPIGTVFENEDMSYRLERLSSQLSQIINRQQLGELILDYASERMRRCILFNIDGDVARVDQWRGKDLSAEPLSRLSVSISRDSIFSLVFGEQYYHGAVPNDSAPREFYAEMGVETPAEVLIVPIYVDDQLQSVFYGDSGPTGEIDGSTELYLALAEKFTAATNMLRYRAQLSAG